MATILCEIGLKGICAVTVGGCSGTRGLAVELKKELMGGSGS